MLDISACFRCTSSHCWPESMSAAGSLGLYSDPYSLRLRDRWRRCFLCERPDLPDPRDNSLSLSEIRLLRERWRRPERESFDDWLSTELDLWRWPVEFVTLPFRDDADLTDFGLDVMPKSPRWWLFDQPALRVLRGESGVEWRWLLLPFVLLLYLWIELLLSKVAGILLVERYKLSSLSQQKRYKNVTNIKTKFDKSICYVFIWTIILLLLLNERKYEHRLNFIQPHDTALREVWSI